jgi:hypothetical protein
MDSIPLPKPTRDIRSLILLNSSIIDMSEEDNSPPEEVEDAEEEAVNNELFRDSEKYSAAWVFSSVF